MSFDPLDFIRSQTIVTHAAIVPELKLHLATEVTPLWKLTEERLKGADLPPPFWAFAWPGGQGMARYILDHPEVVRGKRVMDFASGCGIAAIASMKAGAAYAIGTEIDPLAIEAIGLNAKLNDVSVDVMGDADVTTPPKKIDLILAGDVCYQQAMATRLLRWLWICVAQGVRVLVADPGRAYVPHDSLKELVRMTVPTSRDLEDQDSRMVVVSELFLPT